MQTEPKETVLMPDLEPARPLVPVEPPHPLIIAQQALAAGAEPSAMTALYELAARVNAARAKAAFEVDFAAAQAAMPTIVKDKVNQHTKSRYPDLATVIRETRPLLAQFGFRMSFGTAKADHEGEMRVTARVGHRDGHHEDYWLDLPYDGVGSQGNKSAMNPLQARGSTTAYGQRYLFKLIWNLAIADEDDDGAGLLQTITPEQVGLVNDELTRTGVKLAAFLKWLSIEHMSNLSQRDFPKAIDYLRRKPSAKGGGQ